MRILVFCLLFLLFSCDNPEDKTIIGSWELIDSKCETYKENINEKTDFEYILSFYSNGEYRESINGKQSKDQYIITRNNLILLINSKTSDSVFYKYKLDDHKLILEEVDKNGRFIGAESCSKIVRKLKKE